MGTAGCGPGMLGRVGLGARMQDAGRWFLLIDRDWRACDRIDREFCCCCIRPTVETIFWGVASGFGLGRRGGGWAGGGCRPVVLEVAAGVGSARKEEGRFNGSLWAFFFY